MTYISCSVAQPKIHGGSTNLHAAALRGLGYGWAGPEASFRHVRQAWPAGGLDGQGLSHTRLGPEAG